MNIMILKDLKYTLGLFGDIIHYYRIAHKPNADIEALKIQWAQQFLRSCKVRVEFKGNPKNIPEKVLVVSNHISYMDIPLIMSFLPNNCFVSKAEVRKWPIIGPATEKAGTLFVYRNSPESRQKALESMKKAALIDNKRIVIFPSGTTSIKATKQWKKGMFSLAAQTGIPILPLRILYTPLRRMAYIDDDGLFPHLMNLARHGENVATVEFGEPVIITNPATQADQIRTWCEAHLPRP